MTEAELRLIASVLNSVKAELRTANMTVWASNVREAAAIVDDAIRAPRTEEQRKYVEIGMLHRRRTGEVDFHQEVFSIPLALHGTLKVFMEASVSPLVPK